MRTAPKIGGTFYVCTDCLHADADGEEPIDRPADQPETWALWENDEHDVTIDDETEGSFSWSSCEGCGSTLGGDRYRYVWWE